MSTEKPYTPPIPRTDTPSPVPSPPRSGPIPIDSSIPPDATEDEAMAIFQSAIDGYKTATAKAVERVQGLRRKISDSKLEAVKDPK